MKKPAQAFTACTLKDLRPEDKQKVAQLVKQVVELGKENQQLMAAANAASSAEDKLRQVQACNKQAVVENCSLKNKLGQAITVLRMYHHKVQGLDAALRALQHTPAAGASATGQQDKQLQAQQEQEQQEDTAAGHAEPLPLPAPAHASQPNANVQDEAEQQQKQQQSKDAATTQAGCEGSSTASSQQAEPEPASEPAGATAQHPEPCPGQDASSVQQQCRPQSAGSVQQLSQGAVVLGRPLQQLWDTSLFAGQQVLGPSALLRFDASLGSQGAYVLQGLPVLQPQLLPASTAPVSVTGSPAAFASPAPASVQQLSPEQANSLGLSRQVPTQQQQEQQQQEQPRLPVLSTGGAATAAAAAAASSALAAVRAAAAACAAQIRQPEGVSYSAAPTLLHRYEDAVQCGPCQQQQHGQAHKQVPDRHEAHAAAAGSRHVPVASCAAVLQAAAAVEEVPVVDVAEAPVHVLVHNEKSASSLLQALTHVTLAGVEAAVSAPPGIATAAGWCDAWPGGSSGLPAASQGGHRAGEESSPAAAWQPPSGEQQQQGPSSAAQEPRRHVVLQERVLQAHDAQYGTSLGSSTASPSPAVQQQWILGLQAQQQAGTGPAWRAAAADLPSQQQPAGISGNAGRLVHKGHDTQAAPQRGDTRRSRKVPPLVVVQQQQQQPRQRNYPEQQQLGAAWPGPPVCNTRELLQRFDESLVDILAEVERLEQQQQLVRQQLQQPGLATSHVQPWQQQEQRQERSSHQQHPQQQQQWQEQQQLEGQQWQHVDVADNGAHTRTAVEPSFVRPAVASSSWLDQKQAQLQQRLQRLQQEDMQLGGARHTAAGGRSGRAVWQRPQQVSAETWAAGEWDDGGYDADDVSEILNHMD